MDERYGVKSQVETDRAWNSFMESRPELGSDGKINPDAVKNWASWFENHPDALPKTVRNHLQGELAAKAQQTQASAQSGVVPQYAQSAQTSSPSENTGINSPGNFLQSYWNTGQ